ncbi:NAD(P)/FAD-dependent oxidoreductase [Neomegalonema sp.]|uniref:NAD(P)/FAD-dependent oxidoreductase n=1 Tax=Neomegalonema sp. TaxID=2039713 RepID=UPI002639F50A|nr:NAD(P)/FAD-dependent oxidoreductase [Neomegalonema sp.]MDD2866960.1 NAD(P)/FAD-dependent oxidoreductase [Neomegalonema sp.]
MSSPLRPASALTRRGFGKLTLGAAAFGLATPSLAQGAAPRLVVVGAGPGGATLARYAAQGGGLSVTLIDENPHHITCPFSNYYLGGLYPFEDLVQGFDKLKAAGIEIVQGRAADLDREGKAVILADGTRVPYDALALAPGIDFKWDAVEGYTPEIAETLIPHAYKAGPQTQLLRAQLDALEDGGTVVVAVPGNPYRCPPGPYERVSLIAHLLKSTGRTRAKILLLDAKSSFSKQALFEQGWTRHYPGMIEWVPAEFTGGGFASLDAGARTVTGLSGEVFHGDVINFIPPQKAGAAARLAGLAGEGDWAPVLPETLQSAHDPDILILGDAAAQGDMPKSAFSANSQAKSAAAALRARLLGARAFPARYLNTCWSLIEVGDAVKIGATYKAGAEKIETAEPFISETGESAETRKATEAEAYAWYESFVRDVWG